MKGVDGARGPRFNQSSLVIEAAVAGRGVALAKRTLAQADLDAQRLVAPLQIATAVDFAYYLVHPRAKGRLPQDQSLQRLDRRPSRRPRSHARDDEQRRGDLTTLLQWPRAHPDEPTLTRLESNVTMIVPSSRELHTDITVSAFP